MKKLTNMTTHSFDLERFGDNAGLKVFLKRHGLDGLELMEIGADEKKILRKEDVAGFHLVHFPCWYCFWKKDSRTLLEEFGNDIQKEDMKFLLGILWRSGKESFRLPS